MQGCGVRSVFVLAVGVGATQQALGAGAARDLSQYAGPGITFVVSIAIDPPASINAVGVEESPPAGWSVSAVSDSGAWDAQTGKVKWGPFFDPSIPTDVTYEVSPPLAMTSEECFSGTVSFDGADEPIGGDECIAIGVPALSQWGLAVMLVLVLAAGAIVLRSGLRRPLWHGPAA